MSLTRRTPLKRSPWRRKPAPAATPDMSAPLALVLAAGATVAQAARIHGCDPDALEVLARKTWSAAVLERDGYRCAGSLDGCRARATDAHHRIPKGIGGNANPKIAFGLSNGTALCRLCHALVHKRGQDTYRRGLWLLQTDDPEAVPVVELTPGGPASVWLLADGSRSSEPPAVAA